jgi:zinc transport system substrate-binding protein
LKAKQQAETIAAALQEADPSHAEDYERNLKAFQERLQALHEDIAEQLADLEHRRFLVYHPAWGYFADAYGLEQVPIEIEGKEPTARQLAQIIDYAKEQGIQAIFVQQQFSRKTGQAIASAIGGEVIAIDPLARNYFENLRTIAQRLAEALR